MSDSSLSEELIIWVKLEKTLSQPVLDNGLQSVSITITAKDAVDDTVPIFVFQREVYDPGNEDATQRDRAFFSNVCTPTDWQELPIGVPTDDETNLFRYHQVVAICQTMEEAEEVWDAVVEATQDLIDHHKALLAYIDPDSPQDEEIIS